MASSEYNMANPNDYRTIRLIKRDSNDDDVDSYWANFLGLDIDITLVTRSILSRYTDWSDGGKLTQIAISKFLDKHVKSAIDLKRVANDDDNETWQHFLCAELLTAIEKYSVQNNISSVGLTVLKNRLRNSSINRDPRQWF